MQVRLIAIGQKMPAWVEEAYRDYSKRIKGDMRVELVALPMAKRSKNTSEEKMKAQEGKTLLNEIKPKDFVVALDVKGKAISTEALATQLTDWQQQGRSVAFFIGGPDGLSQEVINAADVKLSLSALTLPHPLVRVLVIEQLYRAWSINHGHPYHR
ncbi:MAG: 23S rRNA (pseudouridine(1915)-N(3))-methyltransferase RlmH [Cellvibrionales bacterium]|nr:23S rRNA (pseudouridine(1915)-N(3))-methyltransferase RlmH [Cellvibrionales bacterium]